MRLRVVLCAIREGAHAGGNLGHCNGPGIDVRRGAATLRCQYLWCHVLQGANLPPRKRNLKKNLFPSSFSLLDFLCKNDKGGSKTCSCAFSICPSDCMFSDTVCHTYTKHGTAATRRGKIVLPQPCRMPVWNRVCVLLMALFQSPPLGALQERAMLRLWKPPEGAAFTNLLRLLKSPRSSASETAMPKSDSFRLPSCPAADISSEIDHLKYQGGAPSSSKKMHLR